MNQLNIIYLKKTDLQTSSQLIDERMLVIHLKSGDKRAFADIYGKYHRQIYMIALKYLKDEELAQDIVQEIFIKLWTYRENLKEELSLKGFLLRSAHNLIMNTIRNKKTAILKHVEIGRSSLNSKNPGEDKLILSEYLLIAEKGINELSPARQTIFRMRSAQCLSNEEVATKLGLSINTVKFQFSQASKFLRNYLKENADL